MKPNNYAQNKQHAFESLSKKNLKHQTRNYYDELKRQEVIFFNLFVRKMEQLYTVDKYFITERFYNVLGLAVNIIDKKHVCILRLVKYTNLLFLCNKLRLQATPEFNINQTTLKTAICNKQIAVFLLTKYLYFRLKILKPPYIFLHYFNLDKLYLLQVLKYSSVCRSPPLFLVFKIKKSENGGNKMGFNYSKEKFIFDREWEKLREQYAKSGMGEETIQELYDFDWTWFRARRNYANRVQALPDDEIDEQRTETRSNLFRKFASLSINFDETELSGRYAWIDTISNDTLSKKLKNLSEDELELLTLLAIEGYTQREIARKMHCSQNAISKRLIKIRRILKEI